MRKLLLVLPLVFALFAGCMTYKTPIKPPCGFIYTQIRAPLTDEYNKTAIGTRSGSASTIYILGIALDKCDIETAARNGNLKTVNYADYELTSVLGLFARFTVIAHGD